MSTRESEALSECKLDLRETFYFYRNVRAVDNGASRGAIGQSTQTGAKQFRGLLAKSIPQ